jgi:hypothetical protein
VKAKVTVNLILKKSRAGCQQQFCGMTSEHLLVHGTISVMFVDQSWTAAAAAAVTCWYCGSVHKFHDLSLKQHIVEKTNKYAEQQTAESATPFTLHLRITWWKGIVMSKMYVLLALFILRGIAQKPTQRYCYSRNSHMYTPFLPEAAICNRISAFQ